MAKDKKTYSRRDALDLIGKGVIASALAGTFLSNAQTTEAKAYLTLDFVVKDYRVYIHSAPQYSWTSRMYLRSANGKSCTIYFMKDGQTIPGNSVSSNGISGKIYFPHNRYEEIREFLRYEKPVRLTLVGSNGIATLSNDSYELVGDLDA